jgi:hypothetical protein
MGQPVTVVHKPSRRAGVERFEINRSITGMDHERYVAGEEILGERPVDRIARALLQHGGVDAVSVNSNVITVDVAKGGLDIKGAEALIADMFTYYRPGVEVPAFASADDGDSTDGG